jgi:hypothetical protein
MATKKQDSTGALVAVVKALEPLSDADKQWVLQSAASRWTLSIQLSDPRSGIVAPGVGIAGAGRLHSSVTGTDVQTTITKKEPRAFIRLKKPTTDVERVACLGYYLLKTTGLPGFTSKDISQAHVDSGGSAINMTRALDNATRQSRYLSSRGKREKQLTTLGEDVVEALPNREALAAVEEAARIGRKRKGKRRTKKSKPS